MTPEQREELKPCPFCGGPVTLERAMRVGEMGARDWWGIKCRNTMNLGGTCAIEQIPSGSPEAAIERWNRRAQVEALQNAIESDDRVLRSSVPDKWKDCTSPVGAVQSYIAELEGQVEALTVPQEPFTYTVDGIVMLPLEYIDYMHGELSASKRKALELQRVYDERGLQIGRLEVALQRAKVEALTVPQGWKCVPIEPTIAMLVAGGSEETPGHFDRNEVIGSFAAEAVYTAMIEAAPTIPAIPGTKEGA